MALLKIKKKEIKKPPEEYLILEIFTIRKDKHLKPTTKLKCIAIKKSMGWCDDPKNKKYYNKLIKIKKSIKHESLYRKILNMILLFQLNIILEN